MHAARGQPRDDGERGVGFMTEQTEGRQEQDEQVVAFVAHDGKGPISDTGLAHGQGAHMVDPVADLDAQVVRGIGLLGCESQGLMRAPVANDAREQEAFPAEWP